MAGCFLIYCRSRRFSRGPCCVSVIVATSRALPINARSASLNRQNGAYRITRPRLRVIADSSIDWLPITWAICRAVGLSRMCIGPDGTTKPSEGPSVRSPQFNFYDAKCLEVCLRSRVHT